MYFTFGGWFCMMVLAFFILAKLTNVDLR